MRGSNRAECGDHEMTAARVLWYVDQRCRDSEGSEQKRGRRPGGLGGRRDGLGDVAVEMWWLVPALSHKRQHCLCTAANSSGAQQRRCVHRKVPGMNNTSWVLGACASERVISVSIQYGSG